MRWIEEESFERLAEDLEGRGFSTSWIKEKVKSFKVETPSWGYRDSGTRFAVFHQPGAARDVHECLEDAAFVHRLTGACPSVALHIPWDRVDDFGALREEAEAKGVRIGAINPNLFQDPDYKFGSLANPKPEVRKKALEHIFECVDIMEQVGSEVLSLWFADGTDYPGQGDFRRRKAWMEEGLREVYERLPGKSRMLIEYKFFEPAFYHTDIPDWGTAYALATKLGPKAQVLVDTGHHPQGTNIEFLVAFLISEGKLGGFHFNDRKYADDDLTAGSIFPYQLFLIFNEIVSAELDKVDLDLAYMIDQSHIAKPKVEAMIQTVDVLQQMYAKALLVDRVALSEAQAEGDVVRGEEILREAFSTDVRPLLAQARRELGAEPDPLGAYRRSGYLERVAKERA